jgi:general secretion pathway protein D
VKERFLSFALFALLGLFGSGHAFAQSAETAPVMAADGQVTLDFRDVELADLIQTISELTGRNFLYDDAVKGKVTIVSPQGMSLDEAYQLFLSVLNVKGYTVVPSGKTNKILPIKNAKQTNLPILANGQKQAAEQFVTRLVRLEHLDAATIASTVLAPLLPSSGNIVAYSPTNTLIITESAANIDRLLQILQQLDQPGSASVLEVLPLRNAAAEEVAKICNEVLSQPNIIRTRRKLATTSTAQEGPSKVIAYTRNNSLIVMSNSEDLAMIKGLVARMDEATDNKRSHINLFYLENADAETLATTLNEILTGIKTQSRRESRDGKVPVSSGPVTITADKPTNALVVNASPEDYETLKGIIRQLDIKRKQVYVEALILELSMDATRRLGASLQGGGALDDNGLVFGTSNLNSGPVDFGAMATDSKTGLPSLLTTAIEGLLTGGFYNPVTVPGPNGELVTVPTLSVLIDISKTDSDVNILSAPRLLTSDNEEAEIIVGSNVPVITGRLTDTGGSGGLAQSVAVERQDVALILRFTPQVTEGNLVRLNIYQELTDIVPITTGLAASVGDPKEVGPTFTKRVLRNTVLAENGRTVVLGGLIDTNITESVSKVPLLGDIPLLGALFKHTTSQEEKTNLLVFINPTIIKDSEDLARVTGRNRKAASEFLDIRTLKALPENFFGGQDAQPLMTEPAVDDAAGQ